MGDRAATVASPVQGDDKTRMVQALDQEADLMATLVHLVNVHQVVVGAQGQVHPVWREANHRDLLVAVHGNGHQLVQLHVQ